MILKILLQRQIEMMACGSSIFIPTFRFMHDYTFFRDLLQFNDGNTKYIKLILIKYNLNAYV